MDVLLYLHHSLIRHPLRHPHHHHFGPVYYHHIFHSIFFLLCKLSISILSFDKTEYFYLHIL